MLTLSRFTEEADAIKAGLKLRNWSDDQLQVVDTISLLDKRRKLIQTELDGERSTLKSISVEIGALYKSGKAAEAEAAKAAVGQHKTAIDQLEQDQQDVMAQLEAALLAVPNVPNPKVPAGKSDSDNAIYRDFDGDLPTLGEDAKPHWDLAEQYNLIDFGLGAKITGSGFPLYRNQGARLQRGLINFFLDRAVEAGYEEIIPPLLVNADSARGTGALPDKEGQMYHATKDDYYLIPTAEVPVTNIFRNVIVDAKDFPFKMCAYTPCFRREAGSYGSDVKGLNRVHQFDKIEIVQVTHPDQSYNTLYKMLDHVAGLLEALELPYRVLTLCGGDLTFTSALTYDFEVYSAAQDKWLEVSSVSNFETYQANRMKCRYRDENGKTQLAHTLNGSALALARIVAALLENNQTPEGIVIPEALRSYTGFDIIR
jgi:seryl-tRNA synthetase